jgi:ATP-dependent Lon protease
MIVVNSQNVAEFLGRRVPYGEIEADDQVGLVTGLAWTEVGAIADDRRGHDAGQRPHDGD